MPHCRICGRELNVEGDRSSVDCGGDCVRCLAECGDKDCKRIMDHLRRHSYCPWNCEHLDVLEGKALCRVNGKDKLIDLKINKSANQVERHNQCRECEDVELIEEETGGEDVPGDAPEQDQAV